MIKLIAVVLLSITDISNSWAQAGSTASILDSYRQEAKKSDNSFRDFSAERGKALYEAQANVKGDQLGCSSCHSMNPRAMGKTRAGKVIEPMAPAVNPNRFTDMKKVEKWFLRNCDDVLHRNCSATEKGDFISYLLTIR